MQRTRETAEKLKNLQKASQLAMLPMRERKNSKYVLDPVYKDPI